MIARLAFIALSFAATISLPINAVSASSAPLDVPISAKSVRADVFPPVQASFPGGIVALPHIEFANYVGFRPLQLDLYVHADRAVAKRRPTVLWVHGGGWNRGDARASGAFTDFPAVLATLAARGYVVASVDYRLSSEARFPAQIQDVKGAIRFLRAHAAEYGIDSDQIYVWGGSAGGHLAALAATTCGIAAFDPPPSGGRLSHSEMSKLQPSTVSDCAQAAVIWYGIFDFVNHQTAAGSQQERIGGVDNVTTLLGCDPKDCPAQALAASPIHYVGKGSPPMLLIHGMADTEVSFHQSERMAAAMRKAGASVETLFLSDINHGLIGKTPEATRTASLQGLERSFDFFDRMAHRAR